MVALTYGVARVPAAKIPATKTPATKSAGSADTTAVRKPWYARFHDALIEARMQQARREIRMHLQLLPYTFDERGNRLVKRGANDMSFARND